MCISTAHNLIIRPRARNAPARKRSHTGKRGGGDGAGEGAAAEDGHSGVRQRAGSELIDRIGIRTEAERAEIQIRKARKARLLAQAKALAKAD